MLPRRGFTLVELLVVIAIIALLVALLIPAVQAAREAGRRITCANHMKQFALAVANYASANEERLPPIAMQFYDTSGRRILPQGWECESWGQRHSHSWRVAVLPFLEEQALYDMFDFSVGNLTETNLLAITRVLPVFQCPSTPGYPRAPQLGLGGGIGVETSLTEDVQVGAWDYGVPGDAQTGSWEAEFAATWYGQKNRRSFDLDLRSGSGPCHWAREFGPAKLVWVTDGLSKTTVAYELATQENSSGRYATGWSQMWHFRVTYGPINKWGRFSFHPGGVNNAFLDGSVRFLDEEMPQHLLQNLDYRSDGLTDHYVPPRR